MKMTEAVTCGNEEERGGVCVCVWGRQGIYRGARTHTQRRKRTHPQHIECILKLCGEVERQS